MSLRNTDQIKTVGQTNYVPPEVYSSWSVDEQITYVTIQSQLGYLVKAAKFNPIDINSFDELLKLNYSAKEDFAVQLQAQFGLTDSQVPTAVQQALQNLLIVTETLKNTVRQASGYSVVDVPEGFSATTEFTITNQRIQRKSSSVATENYLTAIDFKKLFNEAYKKWRLNTDLRAFSFRRRCGDSYSVEISLSTITIGCQTIKRYEAEAIAIELGFLGQPFNV